VEFLPEALARWGQGQKIRIVRADSGFFEDKRLRCLEPRALASMGVARWTKGIEREAQRVQSGKALDEIYSVGEFQVKRLGSERERGFVGVRERVREGRDRQGRKRFEVPVTAFASSSPTAPLRRRRSGATTTGGPTGKTALPNASTTAERMVSVGQSFSLPKPPSRRSCCGATGWRSFRAPPVCRFTANRPRCAPQGSPVAPFSAARGEAGSSPCPQVGAG
jgi:hypothetical protein